MAHGTYNNPRAGTTSSKSRMKKLTDKVNGVPGERRHKKWAKKAGKREDVVDKRVSKALEFGEKEDAMSREKYRRVDKRRWNKVDRAQDRLEKAEGKASESYGAPRKGHEEPGVSVKERGRRKVTKFHFEDTPGRSSKYVTVKDKAGDVKKKKTIRKYPDKAKYKVTSKKGMVKSVTKGGHFGKKKVEKISEEAYKKKHE